MLIRFSLNFLATVQWKVFLEYYFGTNVKKLLYNMNLNLKDTDWQVCTFSSSFSLKKKRQNRYIFILHNGKMKVLSQQDIIWLKVSSDLISVIRTRQHQLRPVCSFQVFNKILLDYCSYIYSWDIPQLFWVTVTCPDGVVYIDVCSVQNKKTNIYFILYKNIS